MIKRAENHRISSRTSIVQWLCRCDCGKEVIVRSNNLGSGNTTSCGCQSHETLRNKLFVDLTGRRFGRLLVLEQAPDRIRSDRKRHYWKCLCDCGAIKEVEQDGLLEGKTHSCGCLKSDYLHSEIYLIDLTGQRFGFLTVIRRYGFADGDHVTWLCRCDCGQETIVRGSCLKNGTTQSCGCKTFSIGEGSVNNELKSLGLNYTRQKTFPDLIGPGGHRLRFDFALYDQSDQLVALIEYQGQQHYTRRIDDFFGKQQREITDPMKREYCSAHNIPLFEIKYDEENIRQAIIDIAKQLNLSYADTVPSLDSEEGVTTIPQGST